ncbi:hypothetical protein BCD96_002667 [Clostridium beijerinckii]|jgi:hypothetical protein|uniref:Uncharacterized protein n=1 Tax=Clostridium beijerinckii TaxID=1520 RepID=A0A1S8ST43_CLOBE|nr:hypothetical protein [Clostridium beijerinckii]NOV70854.1 hypothetical protein [Clostridium beijerinckii]NOW33772.1 hypothetical protein [Clostridium beijerinckii]NOW83441.1 hypothetical protein [Clostridium beijerinckii]NRT35352.1 hypothetical protein [Clostridium beijerinckii]
MNTIILFITFIKLNTCTYSSVKPRERTAM